MESIAPASPVGWSPPARPPVPATVMAAAVITWISASGSALLSWPVAAFFLISREHWDDASVLPGGPGIVATTVVVALVLTVGAVVADVAALKVVRGSKGARYVLGALATVAAVASVAVVFSSFPPLVTLFGAAVLVLLLTPSARRWPAERAAALGTS